ncbi:hypothetical protein [Providencia huaxiensis]|uniref:hypothetical protein n=1 Tax=Providencia huaxiensis TaxID=2027290 RepID=UPI000B2FD240
MLISTFRCKSLFWSAIDTRMQSMTVIASPHVCCNDGIITDLSSYGCIPEMPWFYHHLSA